MSDSLRSEILESVSDGLAGAIDKVAVLGAEARDHTIRFHRIPGTDSHYAVLPDGTVERIDPEWRSPVIVASNLDGLLSAWNTIDSVDRKKSVFLVTENNVAVLIDSKSPVCPDGAVLIEMPLNASPVAELFRRGCVDVSQVEVLQWLRSRTVDLIPNGRQLFANLRHLKFRNGSVIQSQLTNSKSNYGSEIAAAVDGGTGECDFSDWDRFSVSLPIIDDPDFVTEQSARAFVEINPVKQTVSIALEEGEWRYAWDRMRRDLADTIRDQVDKAIPVIVGSARILSRDLMAWD